MVLEKEWLEEAKEIYCNVRKLVDEESKKDPVSEPYKSKYEARKILKKLESELNVKRNEDQKFANVLSALINYELGVTFVETEELSDGEEYLKKCLEDIKGNYSQPDCCILSMKALNHLGILWSERNELNKAQEYLKQSESVYFQYREHSATSPPVDLIDLFSDISLVNGDRGNAVLEKIYTHTLYYLAQVYQNLDENETSAMYCHLTLKRQLESGDYQPVDWSLNCATLSQYYFSNDNFSASRHALACADYILSNYEKDLKSKNDKCNEEVWEKVKHCKASIARCWIKYGLLILSVSEQNLLMKASEDDENNVKEQKEEKGTSESSTGKQYILLVVSEVTEKEQMITNQCILDFSEARSIFLFMQNWLKVAKEYYTLDGHATDYVQLTQDLSSLYKLLAFFESDVDRQCKMHKRRIDILEEVLQQLNPQFYLLICRQLMFELAETYSEIMDIKIEIMEESKVKTNHTIKKVNILAIKSIQYFEKFIHTLKGSNKKLPEKFADDVVRPALIAHFCMGRLYSKLSGEPHQQLEYLNKTKVYYNYIIDYIGKNPSHTHAVKKELPLIKEMVQLIPVMMQRIISGTLY